MQRKTIYFKGFIANAGSSILKVNLNHGFKFESLSREEGLLLVCALDRSLPRDVIIKLTMRFPCLDSEAPKPMFYCVSNSFEADIELDDEGALIRFPSGYEEFNQTSIYGYLKPALRLMGLFKEGGICMPLWYYFFIDNARAKPFTHQSDMQALYSYIKYNLDDTEISDLEYFIQNISLPFEKPFLELAFENFELSYKTNNLSLAFISLMISLETLLNPSDYELRYRISRNIAILLGENQQESKRIFKEVKKLYNQRSRLIHAGEKQTKNQEDVLKLRNYVRAAIKEINTMGCSKKELVDILNTCGFGERPWRE